MRRHDKDTEEAETTNDNAALAVNDILPPRHGFPRGRFAIMIQEQGEGERVARQVMDSYMQRLGRNL